MEDVPIIIEPEKPVFRTEDLVFINNCIDQMLPNLEEILHRIEYMQLQVHNKVSGSGEKLRANGKQLQEYERQLRFLEEKHQIIALLLNKQKAFDFSYS